MRILFLSNLYPPVVLGGYEMACAQTAKGLKALGHEVRMLTSWSHLPPGEQVAEWVDRGLDLHWHVPHKSANPTVVERDLHSAVCSSYANTLRLLNELQAFNPDVVYVWNLTGVGAAALLDLLNVADVPWIIHLMDRTPVDLWSNARPEVLGLFGAQGSGLYAGATVISMSEHLLSEIARESGIHFRDARIIPGAVDVSHRVPHLGFRRDGVTRFVSAGAVVEHKGIDLILEASSHLKVDGLPFVVDIYGEGELPKYIDMARELEVDGYVRFLGSRSQPELFRLYAEYDAFLFPTWNREPFGFAPVEAAGAGTPPIMTRNCGASERLVDGLHCLKISRTSNELSEAMRRVALGEVDLSSMSASAMRLVEQDMSFSGFLVEVQEILESTASTHRSKAGIDINNISLLAFLKHNLSVSLRFD